MGKLVILSVLFFSISVESIKAQRFFDQFLWKNRLVLVIDNSATRPNEIKQFMAFYKNEAENKNRDLILITLTNNKTFLGFQTITENPQDLLKQLRLKPSFNGVLLLGKDGGIKFKSNSFTNPEDIYALIDSMPMRKQEVKLKKEQ